MILARSQKASTLALVGVSTIVVTLLLLFALLFCGANFHVDRHRTAIDAAALKAAEDVGQIVYNSPECGWVSLTGVPPTNPPIQSPDGWIDQVRSLNELMSTARLNYILACNMGVPSASAGVSGADAFLQRLALNDQSNVLKARDELMQILQQSLRQGGYGLDAAGNRVMPYDDALNTYLSNQQSNSVYVDMPPTFQLTLGCLQGGVTTAIPVPVSSRVTGVCPLAGQADGFYISDTDLTYNGQPFMLGSVGSHGTIVDKGKFCPVVVTPGTTSQNGSQGSTSAPTYAVQGLVPAPSNPYLVMPSAVKVEADQKFSVQGKTFQNHFASCAAPGGNFTAQPNVTLALSFPDGPLPEINCLADIYATSIMYNTQPNQMTQKSCDVYAISGGDFPTDPGAILSTTTTCWSNAVPFSDPNNPTEAELAKLCIYYWIRSAGISVNIDSVLVALTKNFSPNGSASNPTGTNFDSGKNPVQVVEWASIDASGANVDLGIVPAGIQYIFGFTKSGRVKISSQPITAYPYTVVAENQLYAENRQDLQGTAQDASLTSQVAPWTLPNNGTSVQLTVPQGLNASALAQPVSLQLQNKIDVYFRDEVLQRGSGQTSLPTGQIAVTPAGNGNGGKHAGAPLYLPEQATNVVSFASSPPANSSAGNTTVAIGASGGNQGAPPVVSNLDDFANTTVPRPPYTGYNSGNGSARPVYFNVGLAAEIRFRRRMAVVGLTTNLTQFGYPGSMRFTSGGASTVAGGWQNGGQNWNQGNGNDDYEWNNGYNYNRDD